MSQNKTAYELGWECGRDGANEQNCHFSIFSSPENTKAWEAGKRDAEERFKRHTL
jgi:hypothetical protein